MDPTCCPTHVIQHFPRMAAEGTQLLIQLHKLILQRKLMLSQQQKVTESHHYETLDRLEKIFAKNC